MIKTKAAFTEGRLFFSHLAIFSHNPNPNPNPNPNRIALIGWIKVGPPKKPLLF